MKITAISDLHGEFPQNLPGGDILILAGDYALNDHMKSWVKFYRWLNKQDYEYVVYIAGNHDNFLVDAMSNKQRDQLGFSDKELEIEHPKRFFLRDSLVNIKGIKIYGSPWTPFFDRVNKRFTAHMIPESELYVKFVQIPENLDILVTHGPPWGILDQCFSARPVNCGSKALCKEVLEKKPKYHIFGHIHERVGLTYQSEHTCFMNVAHCDEFYMPRKEIRTFEI